MPQVGTLRGCSTIGPAVIDVPSIGCSRSYPEPRRIAARSSVTNTQAIRSNHENVAVDG